MDVAALNEIGITLCMIFGVAVFYFVGRKNARKAAERAAQEEAKVLASRLIAEREDQGASKEPGKDA